MRVVTKENCLATKNPEIALEWHPSKNAPKTPYDVIAGSEKKYWWLCKNGHEWQSVCYSRTSAKKGCPYCAGRSVCYENCLNTTQPTLTSEWHPTKNGSLTACDVTHGCKKKVWWKCKNNHEWIAACYSRSCAGNGCPYCTAQKVCYDNCLLTRYPDIASEWHPVKNGLIKASDVTGKSHKKIWWICKKGHEWLGNCNNRTCGKNCPYCANKRVCYDNCLQTLFPLIAAEWHPTKNYPLTPEKILAGTAKKYWWRCKKGHEWYTDPSQRTISNTGCPICRESKGENKVAKTLECLNLRFKRQAVFKSCKRYRLLPFDFMVYLYNKIVLIEYHGMQHYKPIKWSKNTTKEKSEIKFNNIKIRDNIKATWADTNKIPLLVISYLDENKVTEIVNKFITTHIKNNLQIIC